LKLLIAAARVCLCRFSEVALSTNVRFAPKTGPSAIKLLMRFDERSRGCVCPPEASTWMSHDGFHEKIRGETHFPPVAQVVGFGPRGSKMLCLSIGIDRLLLRHIILKYNVNYCFSMVDRFAFVSAPFTPTRYRAQTH
jgi:hypothetical protein